MKKLFVLVCLILPVMSLYAKGITDGYRGTSDEKVRTSYAFGMLLGSNISSTGLEFDYTALAEGIRAVIEKTEPQFTEQEAMEIVEAAMQVAMEKLAGENREKEIEFLAKNRERPEVQVTESGLQYEIISEAEGEKPLETSVVRVHYTGTFMDDTPFDSSMEEEGAYIPLGMVIPGWTEGLLLMSVGSTYRFYIPSSLAYGRDGVYQVIPTYATLIFTVTLLEIINDQPFGEF
jgi:FKBP-type peptidyl-prolyl cis-trans isomerase